MNTYTLTTNKGKEVQVKTNANEKQWSKIIKWINEEVAEKTERNIVRELKTFSNVVEIEII